MNACGLMKSYVLEDSVVILSWKIPNWRWYVFKVKLKLLNFVIKWVADDFESYTALHPKFVY